MSTQTITLTDDAKVGYDDGTWHASPSNFYISANTVSIGSATTNAATFTLSTTINAASTINSCYLRMYIGGASSGNNQRAIAIEETNPNSNTVWGSGHRPVGATYGSTLTGNDFIANSLRYNFGVADDNPQDLKTILQHLIDTYGQLTAGCLLNFGFNGAKVGGGFSQLHDPSSGEPPLLIIDWTPGNPPVPQFSQRIYILP
jgi:hypothetical protein